jgi:AcrR family transcriptional regulator
MPRISAPTVAEHRQRQRTALLDAAEAVIVESGVAGLTFAAVAQRAGLARSSVYEYFPSPAALLAELVVDRMRGWGQATGERLLTISDPAERVAEYVRLSLSSAGPEHRSLAQAVSASDLPPECADALVMLHAEMSSPLVDALRDLKVKEPDRAANHVNGVIESSRRSIQAGSNARTETRSAIDFVLAAVGQQTR